MRLTTVLLIASLMQVSAAGFAQKISLSEKNASLDKVLDKIYAQSGFDFIINASLLRNAKPVNINVTSVEIKDVLHKIFEDQSLDFEIQQKMVVVRKKEPLLIDKLVARFQEIEVTGKVVDEKNQPIAGATIKVRGTNLSTATDNEGAFILKNIQDDAVLEIYSIGYSPREIKVADGTGIIRLSVLISELQEVQVVNTGYQRLPKERLTGSFEQIQNSQLNIQYGASILNRLEGMASSLVFDPDGQRPAFTIRGVSTINASKSPLIILDNFPYAGDINNINPNDIESVTILKDAAAASIWGARAGNGVIVITSKQGRAGQPISINLNTNVSFHQKPDIYQSPNFMSPSDYIDLEQFLYSKGFYQSILENTNTYPVVSPVVALLAQKALANPAEREEIDRRIQSLKTHDVRTDINKYLYKSGLNQQYAFNINGGTEKSTYYYASGYDRGENHLGASNDRFSLRAQNTFEISSRLSLVTGIQYTKSNSNTGRPDYTIIRPAPSQALYPYAKLADDQGKPLSIPKTYRESYIATAGGGKLLDWRYYPLEDYKHTPIRNQTADVLANASVDYTFFPWLKATVRYQFENQKGNGRTLYEQESFFSRNLINQFSQINPSTGTVKYIVPKGGILDLSQSDLTAQNIRAQINLDQSWGEHHLNALAGAEGAQNKIKGNSYRSYGYNDELGVVTGLVDPVNSYPLIYGGTATIGGGNTFNGTDNRSLSYFANAAYTYRNRYSISASLRKDQSNIFGVNTNQRGRPFGSAGASWELSKENFYTSTLLPYLKLRATYGSSGNVDNSMSALTAMSYSISPNSQTGFAQALINKFENPDLRWEKTQMANFGLDFATRGNRISGSLEYYVKSGTDLLGDAIIDPTTGLKVPTVRKNVASMKGKGIDLTLHTVNIDGLLKWSSTLLFSYNRNQVEDYYLNSYLGSTFINQGNLVTPIEGHPVYSIFSYKWAGLDPENGNPRGYLGGEISQDYAAINGIGTEFSDLVFNGPSMPVYTGTIGNTVLFRGFELSANLLYKLGYYFRKNSIDYGSLFSGAVQHKDYLNRWQTPGDERFTSVPSLIYPADPNRDAVYSASEALVRKADHIRLQFVSLSYAFQSRRLKQSPFRELKVTLIGSNLGMLWQANPEGIDPDYPYALSPSKTLSFGIKAIF